MKFSPLENLYKSPAPTTATPRQELLLLAHVLLLKENNPLLPRMKPRSASLSQLELDEVKSHNIIPNKG